MLPVDVIDSSRENVSTIFRSSMKTRENACFIEKTSGKHRQYVIIYKGSGAFLIINYIHIG
jgi:hypothetical protein